MSNTKKIVPLSIDGGLQAQTLPTPTSHVNQALKQFVESTRGSPKYLYQSATPTFDWYILIEQFLVQCFNPISRIYLTRTYGWQSARNQFSGPLQIQAHLYWFVGVFYLVFREKLQEGGITDAEVGIIFFAGTILRLTIATKYASMTRQEYLTFIMCEDLDKANEYQQHTQLVTGWLAVDIPFCLHESNLALGRMGFHLGSTLPPCFEVKCREIRHWKSILGESSSVLHTKECGLFGKDASVNVDVADLMAMIIAACDYKDYLPYFLPPVFVIILTWSLLPCIVRVSCSSLAELVTYDDVEGLCKSSSFFGDGALANVFSVLLTINAFFVSFPLYMFFVATILGSIRHQKCAVRYGQLARIDAFSPTVDQCPIIDMTVHTNVRAWVRSMLALHFFGNRYYNRVDIFAKLCALILVGLLIWLYVFSLQISSDATGANELILDIRYWSVCFLLIVWGGAFALILGIMSDTNFVLKQHEVIFLLHRLSVREKRVTEHRKQSMPQAPQKKAPVRGLSKRASGVLDSGFVGAILKTMSMVDPLPPSPTHSPREQFNQEDQEDKEEVNREELEEEVNEKTRGQLSETLSIGELEHMVSGNPSSSQAAPNTELAEDVHTTGGGKESMSVEEIEAIRAQGSEGAVPSEPPQPAEEMQARWLATSQMLENEQLDDLMDTAVMILESQMRVNPRRFLGASASWTLVKSYTFAWASLIAFSLTVAGINYST